MQPYSAPLEPVDVEVHVDQRQLRVAWSDGHAAVYTPAHLRLACKCALCEDEWSGERRLEAGAVNRGQFRERRRTAETLLELVTYGIEPALSTETVSRTRNPSAGRGELHQQRLEHNPAQ